VIDNFSVVRDADGHVDAVVGWPHRRGGQGHCLVRLYPFDGRIVAVVSEISSNDDRLGIADDMGGVAGEALDLARAHLDAEPQGITWIAHHGAFSYYDAFDPDTFTLVPLVWDGRRYQDNLQAHRLLTEQEVRDLLDGRTLEPVPTVLTNLGRPQRPDGERKGEHSAALLPTTRKEHAVERDTISQVQAVGFEAAIDVLAQLIGIAGTKADEAESQQNAAVARQWTSRRDEWAERRRILRPRDTEQVQEILDRDGATLRELLGIQPA